MTTTTETPAYPPRPSATGKTRINALDGLRAVALLIIMGYHFGVGWLQGGFFSLDIFYVLSGYLITGLLVSEYRKRSAIKLSAFWLRRARRLLPALLIVLVAVTLLVRFVSAPGLFIDFRWSALSALFYFSNWFQIASSSNYFVATGAVSPLTHTWSLAVEEQFYLVWPLVVLAVMTLSRTFKRGLRVLLVVSVLGAVGSALEMALLYNPTANTTRLYFGTDTHAQSILVGSVLACAMTMIQMHRGQEGMAPAARSVAARTLLVILGLAGLAGTLILTYTLVGTSAIDYRGGFMLSALSAAAIITGAVCVPSGVIARGLSLGPLVWLGTISYGAYLWHYPVFVYINADQTGLRGFWLLALRFVCTFALAAASYYLVERPVMYGRFWRSLKAITPSVALMGGTVAVILVGTVVPAGVAVSVSNPKPIAARKQVRALIVGDSIALTLYYGMVRQAPSYGVSLELGGHVGCGIVTTLPLVDHGVTGEPFPGCQNWPGWWRDLVAQYHPQVVAIMLGRWEAMTRMYKGHFQHMGDPQFDAYVHSELERGVSIVSAHGAKVAIFTAPYYDSGEQPDGQPWPEDDPARVDAYNKIVKAVAKRHPGLVTVIPLNKYLDPKGHFTWTINGVLVRQGDGVHNNVAGGVYLAPKILPRLVAIGARSSLPDTPANAKEPRPTATTTLPLSQNAAAGNGPP